MDIRDKIWIGLSKTKEKPNFTWTNYRPLTGEGHWQEAIPLEGEGDSLCAIMDPAADFLWLPVPCGGPEIAAFVCELPLPFWAEGPKGCLFTKLPSLTVLYFPEQSTIELTSDCGLDGTKRIACQGNANREELLRLLSCPIANENFDDRSTKSAAPYSASTDFSQIVTASIENDELDNSLSDDKTTKTWLWTSNTIDADYGVPTRHRRETERTLIPVASTRSSFKEPASTIMPTQKLQPHRDGTAAVLTTVIVNSTSSVTSSTGGSRATTVTSTTASFVTSNGYSDRKEVYTFSNLSNDSRPQPYGKSQLKPAPSITEAKINIPKGDNASAKGNAGKEQDKADATQDKSSVVRSEGNLGIKDVTKQIYTTLGPEGASFKAHSNKQLSETTPINTSFSVSLSATQEYPAVVDQGQLLDILDNGTMFDIIELNDTESVQSESQIKENSASPTLPTRSTLNQSTSQPTDADKKPTTTEKDAEKILSTSTQPPSKETLTTKYPKKYQLSATKKSTKDPDLKKSNFADHKMLADKKVLKPKSLLDSRNILEDIEIKNVDKIITKVEESEKLEFENKIDPARKLEQELTKEFEMLPEIKDTSTKLNRTFRKDVPGESSSIFRNLPESPEINILNELNSLADEAGERENIEISFHDETENANITETIVFSSIKRTINDSGAKIEPDIVSILEHVENLDKSLNPNLKIIDPRLKILNQNLPRNNQSEIIKPLGIKRTDWLPHQKSEEVIPHPPENRKESSNSSGVSKETFLPKSLQKELEIPPTEATENQEPSTEEFGPFPSDEPRKVNRHRNLSKNSRKKFYPYFFSRMLG